MSGKLLDPSVLHKLLLVDFDTGKLVWKRRDASLFPDEVSARKWNTKWAGKPAFTSVTSWGYVQGSIFNIKFTGHAVIWAMRYGFWPIYQIDHINGIRSDNRIQNLRDVPQTVNLRNTAKSKRNTSGMCGVRWEKSRKKWYAYGRAGGPVKNLGRFDCFAMAVKARANFNKINGFSDRHGT